MLKHLEKENKSSLRKAQAQSFAWLQIFYTLRILTFSESKPIGTSSQSSRLFVDIYNHKVHGPQGTYVKSKFFYGTIGAPAALLSLQDPHQHKIRGNVVNPLFLRRLVNTLSIMV